MATVDGLESAAKSLYGYLHTTHWQAPLLVGPDPGIRWNARIGRFAKSYLRALPWRDDLVYAQAQKYWIQANLTMAGLDLVPTSTAHEIATACADALMSRQTPDGYWEYPNPEWRGRIATVEGNYAAIGMLLANEAVGNQALVEASERWYHYAVEHIGFYERDGTMAIKYFGNHPSGLIPNNSASAVRVFAMIAEVTGDDSYLEYCTPMVRFMASTQHDTGELPYALSAEDGPGRPHFLCHQYNAFQFLNIADYYDITGDAEALAILRRLDPFVGSAVLDSGAARYDCADEEPEVVYYGGAVGAALSRSTSMGIGDHGEAVDRTFDRLLSRQRADGSFPYSFHNYGVLNDKRSYPRYLSMILAHISSEIEARRSADPSTST